MDMGGHNMGGMSMSGIGSFQTTNIGIAHAFWYLVAATCAIRGTRKLIDILRHVQVKRRHSTRDAVPSKPTNVLSQTYETTLAMFREMSYPAMQPFKGRITRFFTPPPLGHCLFILTFWAIILIMLWTDVLLSPGSMLYGYRWEKPAFRAGWVSITQIPLIYALSCKINVVSIVTGISYERLNWLHRWVSRTLFLTVIVHWAYFFHEWKLADFVTYQIEIMPMVKYGFGAWAVIGWTVITGFGYFRHLRYEIWVLQHVASAGVLLWLLWVHVPIYARYNIWMAIGFVAFDRGVRGVWSLVRNLHLKGFMKGGLGFQGEAMALDNGYLRLTLKDVDFDWKAGQHVFLSIPACGIFESHPFTITNNRRGPTISGDTSSDDLEVVLKCHSGFTSRLRRKVEQQQTLDRPFSTHRVFLSGPWGIPPLNPIERSNALVFISSSTGASYTVPLLEHAVKSAPFVQQVHFYWIVRHTSQISWFEARLRVAARNLMELGVENVEFRIFVTGLNTGIEMKSISLSSNSADASSSASSHSSEVKAHKSHEVNTSADIQQPIFDKKQPIEQITEKMTSSSSSTESMKADVIDRSSLNMSIGRPQSFDPLIRPVVEAARGETVVIACGGKSLMAQVRTYVAGLSDERAVHKGTGAQGIYFWGESYGW